MSPEPYENPFWSQVIDFSKAVAEDLQIELDIISASFQSSTYAMKKAGLKIIDGDNKPDYILTGYWKASTADHFAATTDGKIRFFIFNTDITGDEKQIAGEPRGKFRNWIGHIRPDDVQAGFELADILLDKYFILNKSSLSSGLKIAALFGDEFSSVSTDREKGLRKRLGDKNLNIVASYNTNWDRNSANRAIREILRQHPDVNMIWTASDELALTVSDVAKSHNRKPGNDIVIGGFDWSYEGLAAVNTGELAVSMGGHFMEAGWALVMIYDYHHGTDFNIDPGISIVNSMHPITESNINEYLKLLGDRNWNKIDFRKFSKTYSPDLKKYDFSLDAIFKSFHQK